MVHIDSITDLSYAERVAQHLTMENEVLARHKQKLIEEIARMEGADKVQALLAEMQLQRERIAKLEAELFDASSGRRVGEPEAEAEPAPEQTLRKGHRPTKQPAVPLREVVHELPASQVTCEKCGKERSPIPGQAETKKEITLVPEQAGRATTGAA